MVKLAEAAFAYDGICAAFAEDTPCGIWHSGHEGGGYLAATWPNSTRADSRLAPSQRETSLQSNAVSHWLDANLESALSTLTHWGMAEMAGMLQTTYLSTFSWQKTVSFDSHFTANEGRIDSNLTPNRPNYPDNLIHWRKYASIGLNDSPFIGKRVHTPRLELFWYNASW